MNDRESQVRAKALSLGFDAVGFARADVPLDVDHARYEAFLDAGMHGTMKYLAENREVRRRVDTDAILLGARTVVCVARRYRRDPEAEARDPAIAQHVARYARGRDYHNSVRKKLRQLATFVRSLGTAEAPVEARPIIDDIPTLERAWAARAGLGFVGKNGMLIVPGEGSFVLLGEVVTTLALVPDEPMTERCGACTRCLEACPTQAFARPFELDAQKCIAYLTIELRGPMPVELRAGVGEHLFGCDDCQTVCPFNASARPRDIAKTRLFEPHPLFETLTEAELLALDEAQWSALFEGSPLKRAELVGIARDAAIVLGNRGDASARPALERASQTHPSAVVREAATWALEQLDG